MTRGTYYKNLKVKTETREKRFTFHEVRHGCPISENLSTHSTMKHIHLIPEQLGLKSLGKKSAFSLEN